MPFSNLVIEAAEEVFRVMGSYFSEIVYETCMDVEISSRSIVTFRRQVPCTLIYKKQNVGTGFIDILVGDLLVVEIKAIAKLTNKDEQQVRKYLAATGLDEGLLINFGNDLEIIRIQREGSNEQTVSKTN